MKYLLALFVLVVAACSGVSEAPEQTENTAGVVDDLNLEEIDRELAEIESELNIDEELQNLEVNLE